LYMSRFSTPCIMTSFITWLNIKTLDMGLYNIKQNVFYWPKTPHNPKCLKHCAKGFKENNLTFSKTITISWNYNNVIFKSKNTNILMSIFHPRNLQYQCTSFKVQICVVYIINCKHSE
jgi:hypothetical protein